MFGMPEPLPEHKAVPRFWSGLTQFLAFTATTFALVYGIRHIENKAHEALLGR
jgi:hypothetical protein